MHHYRKNSKIQKQHVNKYYSTKQDKGNPGGKLLIACDFISNVKTARSEGLRKDPSSLRHHLAGAPRENPHERGEIRPRSGHVETKLKD